MKVYVWDDEKNKWLKESRGISFEDIVAAIKSGATLDDFPHPNQTRYPHQRMKIVKWKNYAYAVAYIESEQMYFLRTVYPSRIAMRKYIKKKGVI